MKVAVADVGTNSSHLLIAEAQAGANQGGDFRVLDALKDRTKLGECLDAAGNMTPEGENRLASAMTRFRELAAAAGVNEVRVYATSALREAPNGPEVAARIQARTGVYPSVISGEREGELTYLGVAHSVELGPDNVLLDLGGGSLEFVRGGPAQAADILSLPLGSIRMTRAHLSPEARGSGNRANVQAVQGAVRQALAPHAARFQIRPDTRVILSSGTAEAAAAVLSGREGSINGVHFSVADLAGLLERVRRLSPAQRAKLPGLDKRADTILAGLAVLHAALELLGANEVTVSEGALREGMLIEELSRFQSFSSGLSARQRSVLATAERFGANLGHSQQVAALSRALMDGLIAAGQPFPEEARSLLTAAAALHETGQIVAQSSHHKHSAYLIRHAELRGFGPHDIERIAQVARYHRKSLPKPSHPEFMALPATDRALVSRLSAILRVADGLDRSHAGQTQIHALHKTSAGWTVQISGATPLDLAGARDKADLWAREFGGLQFKVMAAETA
ncbi:Ppx/GppA phosphatase family protein [Deinococcus aquatilis]|jgi:exopolyphosphatase/guanosine-5'-triphosphate,3'-diphosphate pyrophosphatase|uniref:Ppx/GppA phosphatase family protein n=1 Tax=Deinococcus aquatilis TaxID=519440 RepID=UPI00035C11AB|nr:Ppx/GppA phosphatase family protein [Deinococcus aquatilis]